MIHQFRDKRQIGQRKKLFRIIVILILFLVLAFSGILSFSGRFFNYVGKPIWKAKKVVVDGTNSFDYLTRTKSSLLKENNKLVSENSDLKVTMIDYQILKDENNKLKELLNNLPTQSDFILAGILVKPNYSPYDTLIIDVGEMNGVTTGSKVYVNGTVPIGDIKEVYPRTSLVELYSNPNRVTTGIIDGSNVSAELVGRGGSNFEMSVPFELTVPNQALIVLPGVMSEVLAIVKEEISEPTDPIKKVILHSPVNIQNQKWVEVKKN